MCRQANYAATGYHTGGGNRQPAKQTALAPETAFIADRLPHRQAESICSRHPITTQARRQPPRQTRIPDRQADRVYSRLADRMADNLYFSHKADRVVGRQADSLCRDSRQTDSQTWRHTVADTGSRTPQDITFFKLALYI